MARKKGAAPAPNASTTERRKIIGKLFPLAPGDLHDVAKYLVSEEDYDILTEILDGLDTSLIGRDSTPSIDRVHAVLLKLNQLSSVMHSFSTLYMPVNPTTANLKKRSYELILERWSDIAYWMVVLLTKVPPPAAGDSVGLQLFSRVGAACVTVLFRAASDADYWGPAKEEILSFPATADAVFALICLKNPLTGKYSRILNDRAEEPCKILLGVVHPYLNAEAGLAAAVDRLGCLPSKERKKIVDALVVRAEHLTTGITSPGDITGAMQNVYHLFHSILRLVWAPSQPKHIWQAFYRRRFLFHLSSSLQSLIQQAEARRATDNTFWELVTRSNIALSSIAVFASPNPVDSFPQAIEGGFVECILASLSRPLYMGITPQLAIEPLRMLYPFIFTQKIYAAMKKHGDVDLFEAWRDVWGTGVAADIAAQSGNLVGFGRYAYDERREHELNHLNMCNNEKVALPAVHSKLALRKFASHATMSPNTAPMHARRRIGLHTILKNALISQESTKYKSHQRWPSWKTRRDQLILLEIAANSSWGSLSDLRKSGRESLEDLIRDGTTKPISREDAAPYDPNSTIPCIDLVDDRRLEIRYGITVAQRNMGSWTWLNDGWHRRIQSCTMDAERNPNDVVVVEGKFALDQHHMIWVFVKMAWDPDAGEGKRYKIVTSAFRMAVWQWPGGAGNPWLLLKMGEAKSLGPVQVGSRLLQ